MDWRWTFFFALGVWGGITCYWCLVFGFTYCFSHWFLWDDAVSAIAALLSPLLFGMAFLGVMALREHRHENAQGKDVFDGTASSIKAGR
jgi:hypothetical protein